MFGAGFVKGALVDERGEKPHGTRHAVDEHDAETRREGA